MSKLQMKTYEGKTEDRSIFSATLFDEIKQRFEEVGSKDKRIFYDSHEEVTIVFI